MEIKRLKECVQLGRYILKNPYKYAQNISEIWLDSLPVGKYAILFHTKPQWDTTNVIASGLFSVTNIDVTSAAGDFCLISVNNRTTGEPLVHKKVVVNNSIVRYTNKNGEVKKKRYPTYFPMQVKVRDGKDVFIVYTHFSSEIKNNRIRKYHKFRVNCFQIFTDRTLYRPGQTLYFKGVYLPKGKIGKNKEVSLFLSKETGHIYHPVDTLCFMTSEMGSFSGSLKLPAEVGNYRLNFRESDNKYGNKYYFGGSIITVAEYKLPSFHVTLADDIAAVAAGDTLFIRGRAASLTGVPVSNASVHLQIVSVENALYAQADVISDSQGNFKFPYPTKKLSVAYQIRVEADVTDLNGETQSQFINLWVKPEAFKLSVENFPHQIDKSQTDTLQCLVMPKNANETLVSNPITMTITRLEQPSAYLTYLFQDYPKPNVLQYSKEEYLKWFPHSTFDAKANDPLSWPALDTVLQVTKNCRKDSLVQMDIRKCSSGTYRISAFGVGNKNDTIRFEDTFTIFDSNSDSVSCHVPLWVEITGLPKEYHTNCKAETKKIEDTLTIALSSCMPNATVMCRLFQANRHVATHKLKLDGQQMHLPLIFKPKRGESLQVFATVQKDNEFYHSETSKSTNLVYPLSKPKLKKIAEDFPLLSLELTHWNKMSEPGQTEEWELSVLKIDSSAENQAELLAWMVDCSLYELNMPKPNLESDLQFFLVGGMSKIPDQIYPKIQQFYLFHEKSYENQNWNPLFRNPFTFVEKLYLSPVEYFLFGNASLFGNAANSWDKFAVACQYTPPSFEEDNTFSSVRMASENIRVVPNRRVSSALNSTEGVASVDGVQTSVRGNRSDGTTVLYDSYYPGADKVQSVVAAAAHEGAQTSGDYPFAFSPQLKVRSNFQETAFFYPQLRTDEQGKVKFVFTVPDQYSKWHLLAVAHTENQHVGYLSEYMTSMKTLMLQTNLPRFFREGDTMLFQVKISNVKDSLLNGKAAIRFYDAATNEPLSLLLQNADSMQNFSCKGKQSTSLSWRITIPANVSAIGYRVLAQANHYGDGEENVVPVLPKRGLMTESIHFAISSKTDTTVTFQSFINNNSTTLQHYSFTFEVATNPLWYVIRSLPYLMQYGYESNDQLFAKLYANAIARHLVKHNPAIAEVFEQWRKDTVNEPLQSPLYKNEQLKNIMLEETPWVSVAQRESEKNQELARLFEGRKLDAQIEKMFNKLSANQTAKGGWCWYGSKGYNPDITADIVAGYRKLQRMGVKLPAAKQMIDKAVRLMDSTHSRAYQEYQKELSENPKAVFDISSTDVQYLYARSMGVLDTNWLKQNYVQHLMQLTLKDVYNASLAQQAEVAMLLYRIGRKEEAQRLMESLRQSATKSSSEGMYWKQNRSSVANSCECHALLMEAFAEISPRKDELDAMKQWLLAQKEGNRWSNTRSTVEAIYALLLNTEEMQTSSINIDNKELLTKAETKVQIGGRTFVTGQNNAEMGTGYGQIVWLRDSVTHDLASIRVQTDSIHPAFGACYWQYFEDFDKSTAADDDLSISRTLFHKKSDANGSHLDSVTAKNPIHLGEKVTVRLVVRSNRDLEYVHIKDLRASAFELVDVREHDEFQNGLSYRVVPHDASTNFFITKLSKGIQIIDYELIATQSGQFSLGQVTIECMYNPTFRAQSRGERLEVTK